MKYEALISFCGVISMYEGEVREISDKALIKDLIKAGYIKEIKSEVKKSAKDK